jgi:hypothetical protein
MQQWVELVIQNCFVEQSPAFAEQDLHAVHFISESIERSWGVFDPLQQAPDDVSHVNAILDRTEYVHFGRCMEEAEVEKIITNKSLGAGCHAAHTPAAIQGRRRSALDSAAAIRALSSCIHNEDLDVSRDVSSGRKQRIIASLISMTSIFERKERLESGRKKRN